MAVDIGRPFARLIATAALLVLGIAALARLPLDYLPRRSYPELSIGLQIVGASDPAEVTRAGLREIESAARALGRVRGMAGEVRTGGADLTVRFTPGTDPERKAARLETELAGLRRRLPPGSQLSIDSASPAQGDRLALVWLTGLRSDEDAEKAAEALRTIPGVRSVQLFGAGREEIRVELRGGAADPTAAVDTVRREVARALEVPALGFADKGDRRLPVLGGGALSRATARGREGEGSSAAAGEDPSPALPRFAGEGAPSRDLVSFEEKLDRLLIPTDTGAVPLGTFATVRSLRMPPDLTVRYGGKPARALVVQRAPGAPLLAADRALRERLDSFPRRGIQVKGIVGASEAEPLRALLRRLALGALLAMAAGAAAGARLAGRRGALSLALAIPAAVAAAANLFWLAGTPLHLTTLAALTLGVSAVLPLAALRLAQPERGLLAPALTTIAAVAAVPIAVGLASEELGPILSEPARALLLATVGAVLAAALLPSFPSAAGRRRPGGRIKAFQRLALRDPGTAMLAASTFLVVAVALFGGALIPRPGDLSAEAGDLFIGLHLPEGTPLAETEARVRRVEERLAAAEEVERFWSFVEPGQASVIAEIRPRDRRPDRRSRIATRLRYQIASAAAVDIDDGTQPGSGAGFGAGLEDRSEADDDGLVYRAVLRGSDLRSLQDGYDRILHRLANLNVRRDWIRVRGWGTPAVQRYLGPAPWTAPAETAALTAWLSRVSAPPPALPLPTPPGRGQRSLRVVPAGTPRHLFGADRVPQEADLLGRPVLLAGFDFPVTPAALLRTSEEAIYPRISRQSGRFVVPIELQLHLSTRESRRQRRQEIDRNLAGLRLPAGCQLERPSLRLAFWPRERLRLLGLALALPLLLAAVAACRLDSFLRGGIALVPPALGVLAAAPLIWGSLGQADELTLFALAAASALVLPAAANAADTAAADSGSGGGRLYRALRRQTPWLLGAVPALVLGLALPTLAADPSRFRWIVPLRAAALALVVGFAASAALVAPMRLAAARVRERDPEEVRRRRRPPVWSEPGEATLAVRSVTKVYGPGAKALSAVSFELRPGIVGLLGPNGAGKTTLLRILTGLLEPTRGAVLFRGVPVSADNLAEYRRRIGFLPQDFNAYPGFTAEQFLEHWALERGMSDPRARRLEIEELLSTVGLAEHAGRKVRDYSGGMRQRVGIARALLGAPPILIVDEPTTGLDVESRGRFRQILLEAAGERIVLFSTHIASDIEAAALRILLLHRGRLRFDGTPEELVARARGRVFRAVVADSDLTELSHRYRVTARVRVLEGIQARAVARPGEPLAGEAVEPDLEEAYLAEVDLADAEAGLDRRSAERFAFLDRRAEDRGE